VFIEKGIRYRANCAYKENAVSGLKNNTQYAFDEKIKGVRYLF
jgi:hypothetical protein